MSILRQQICFLLPEIPLQRAFFIMNEAGTDVVGFYDTVFMQRGKAGGKRRRKNFCAGRQTGTVWQSEGAALRRPARSEREKRYGLKRFAFQTENAPEGMKKGNAFKRHCLKGSAFIARRISVLKHFQFEMLRISNHTACRFAEKRGFSAHVGPGDAAPPPRVSPFSKLKRSRHPDAGCRAVRASPAC